MPLTAFAAGTYSIQKVYIDKARYNPGDTVNIVVVIANTTSQSVTTTLNFKITHLETTTYSTSTSLTIAANSTTNQTIAWTAPTTDYTGYLVAADLGDGTYVNLAIDVSSDAKRFSRYGYTDDFTAGQTTAQSQALMNEPSQDKPARCLLGRFSILMRL